jgi:hypothetical protein
LRFFALTHSAFYNIEPLAAILVAHFFTRFNPPTQF